MKGTWETKRGKTWNRAGREGSSRDDGRRGEKGRMERRERFAVGRDNKALWNRDGKRETNRKKEKRGAKI